MVAIVTISDLEKEAKRMSAIYVNDTSDDNEKNMTEALFRLTCAQERGDEKQRESARNLTAAAQRIKAETDPDKKSALVFTILNILAGLPVKVGMFAARAVCIGAAGTAVAGGMAIYRGSNGEVLSRTDENRDGILDAVGVDTNRDSNVDMKFEDRDFDGHIDRIANVDAGGSVDVVGNSSPVIEGLCTILGYFNIFDLFS